MFESLYEKKLKKKSHCLEKIIKNIRTNKTANLKKLVSCVAVNIEAVVYFKSSTI